MVGEKEYWWKIVEINFYGGKGEVLEDSDIEECEFGFFYWKLFDGEFKNLFFWFVDVVYVYS